MAKKKKAKKTSKKIPTPVISRGKGNVKKAKKAKPTAIKAKKTTRKRPKTVYVTTPELALKAKLLQKMVAVTAEWNGFTADGIGKDVTPGKQDGSEFGYTRAEVVLEKYSKLCQTHRLHWYTYDKTLDVTKRDVYATVKIALCDIDTGYCIEGGGLGGGNNGVWAANSAQTVALKQGLLELFDAHWVEAEDIGRTKVDHWQGFEKIETVEDFKALFDHMNSAFENTLKGKKDGHSK